MSACPYVVATEDGTAHCSLAAAGRPAILWCPACGINRHWREESPGEPPVDHWPGTRMALPCPRCGVEAAPATADAIVEQLARRWEAGAERVLVDGVVTVHPELGPIVVLPRMVDAPVGTRALVITEPRKAPPATIAGFVWVDITDRLLATQMNEGRADDLTQFGSGDPGAGPVTEEDTADG